MKLKILILLIVLFAISCSQFEVGMDSIGVTSIFFGRYYSDTESQITEKDIMGLYDSSIYSEKPEPFRYLDSYHIISHEKYVKHQLELERINKIEGEKSDSLLIDIFYLNEKKEQKRFIFNNSEQILEYTKMIRLLLNVDGFLPFDKYIKNNN